MELAQAWKSRVALFELLVASEYWLSLASDCRLRRDPEDGRERHLLRAVPGFDFVLYRDGAAVEEGRGEMLVAADLASPGYVDAAGGIGYADADALAFLEVGGRRYYRSRDRVHRFADGGLVYCGRVDQLAKSGGVWVDLETREAAVAAIDGVKAVAIVADAGSYTVNYVSEYVCIHMCVYIYIYIYIYMEGPQIQRCLQLPRRRPRLHGYDDDNSNNNDNNSSDSNDNDHNSNTSNNNSSSKETIVITIVIIMMMIIIINTSNSNNTSKL